MPSGFQQDKNQLQPAFFRVVMDMSNNDRYINSTNHYGGAVNPFNWDNFSGSDLPNSTNNAQRLARGNLRFQRIVEELTKYSDAQILDLECTSNGDPLTGNNLPTNLAFTVRYDRFGIDDYNDEADSPLLAMERKFLKSINNGNASSPYDNESINNTTEAVQEAIMRALIINVSRSVRVYRPEVGAGYQQVVEAWDVTANQDEANYSDLRSTITVIGPLDGTTVITTDNDAE